MHRHSLLKSLESYRQVWLSPNLANGRFKSDEAHSTLRLFFTLLDNTPGCFERGNLPGHVTGSAMVVDQSLESVLLTLHGKLNLWLQLGGHCDGDPLVHEVSMRESLEESGLRDLHFLDYENAVLKQMKSSISPLDAPLPFDIDRHLIPARKTDPEHYHYDVRYIIVADPKTALQISEESKDLKWFSLSEARKITPEPSMHRQFDKLEFLKTSL